MRLPGALVVAVVLPAALLAGSAVGEGEASAPTVLDARVLTCLEDALGAYGDSGQGWTGGDSTWTTALPDGREVFAFSDTFLGPVTPPSRPPDAGFVHNSFVVRDAHGRLSTVLGRRADAATSPLMPRDPDHWFWLGAATYLDGALQVPVTEWRATGPDSFDIEFVGSSLARFDPADLSAPESVTSLPRARGIHWGQWILPDGAWTYIYGAEIVGKDKYLHLARVTGGDLRAPMEFWTGREWSAAEGDSARITDGINTEFSVHRLRDDRYLLVTMAGGDFGDRLVGRYGAAPTGPFGPAATLYRTPETGASGSYRDPDVYTYNAHAHPEFSTSARLVVSYNVNSVDTAPGGDVYRDVGVYRPRFVLVSLAGGVQRERARREPCP